MTDLDLTKSSFWDTQSDYFGRRLGSQNFGDAEAPPLDMGAWPTSRNTLPPTHNDSIKTNRTGKSAVKNYICYFKIISFVLKLCINVIFMFYAIHLKWLNLSQNYNVNYGWPDRTQLPMVDPWPFLCPMTVWSGRLSHVVHDVTDETTNQQRRQKTTTTTNDNNGA